MALQNKHFAWIMPLQATLIPGRVATCAALSGHGPLPVKNSKTAGTNQVHLVDGQKLFRIQELTMIFCGINHRVSFYQVLSMLSSATSHTKRPIPQRKRQCCIFCQGVCRGNHKLIIVRKGVNKK